MAWFYVAVLQVSVILSLKHDQELTVLCNDAQASQRAVAVVVRVQGEEVWIIPGLDRRESEVRE